MFLEHIHHLRNFQFLKKLVFAIIAFLPIIIANVSSEVEYKLYYSTTNTLTVDIPLKYRETMLISIHVTKCHLLLIYFFIIS